MFEQCKMNGNCSNIEQCRIQHGYVLCATELPSFLSFFGIEKFTIRNRNCVRIQQINFCTLDDVVAGTVAICRVCSTYFQPYSIRDGKYAMTKS